MNRSFDYQKYKPFPPIPLSNRSWPDKQITKAPTWCSVDLRDGNQALINPMTVEKKCQLFDLLVKVGFKEIEIGFPAASQPDYDFVRLLIEKNKIPKGVTVQVLTQARKELISRSFEALEGIHSATVHLYNSTSAVQREEVFKMNREEVKNIAVNGAKWVKECADKQTNTQWTFQYSPESFTGTELEYSVDVCNAVNNIWKPTQDNPVIINLPSTVEMATPNVYADQIEWFCRNVDNRDAIIISLHTHNDRGCGVAAAELGIMAGAQRVEGTLLGNGERTGNMDVVTIAMNLYSQGVDPELDFSNMDEIINTVKYCTELPIHPRHPYVGEFVYTAFSGSHQDAIKKCLAGYQDGEKWTAAYLPIDPRDLGRSYQEVIRINSQSGKGGVSYVLEQEKGLKLPRWLQIEFSKRIQSETENIEGEISSAAICDIFEKLYLNNHGTYQLNSFVVTSDETEHVSADVTVDNNPLTIQGEAGGVLEAFVNAVSGHSNITVDIVDYSEHSLGHGVEEKAVTYLNVKCNDNSYVGVSISKDIIAASFNAVLSAINQCVALSEIDIKQEKIA